MRVLYTDKIDTKKLSSQDKLYFYNGMDCLICREIFDVIHPMLDETTTLTYEFMLGLQAPILEMELRGCLVDQVERHQKIRDLVFQIEKLEALLNHYAQAMWGEPLNARSWQQKGIFLYDFAQCNEITKYDYKKGVSRRTTERVAIEKLIEKYPNLRPVTKLILKIMDVSKQLGTLRSGIDPDGYFRASYMIGGTETGRLSSKKNVFNRGSNFQNWAEYLRSIFTAPEGPIPHREKYNIPEEYR